MMATIDHPVRLKRGSSGDLDGVMEVMRAAFGDRYGEAWTRSQCAGILPMAGVSLTLATDAETIVGFSLVRSVADESELLLLAVLPTRQRRGVGAQLLDEFVQSAASQGVARVHLEVRDGNPAIEMYRGAGFEAVGRRRNYYRGSNGQQFDALTFAREL
jgi:ribosomal-protein-alanine N-acetyltransferase